MGIVVVAECRFEWNGHSSTEPNTNSLTAIEFRARCRSFFLRRSWVRGTHALNFDGFVGRYTSIRGVTRDRGLESLGVVVALKNISLDKIFKFEEESV